MPSNLLSQLNILDIEASSLDPVRSYPIEVGYLRADGKGESFLINPESAEGWDDWDELSEIEIHHISRETLILEGIDVFDACMRLNKELGGTVWWADGYQMDSFWISRLFEQTFLKPSFDVRPIQDLLRKIGIGSIFLFEEITGTQERTHRALEDCRQIQTALIEIIQGI